MIKGSPMLSPIVTPAELVTGQRMNVEEFLRRWEELPHLKNAELIDGVVHVSSPVSREHGSLDTRIIWWLKQYAVATPGCECGNNSTWLMLDSAPQPDAFLRILPGYGGQSRDERKYCAGGPELTVEVCLTSTEVDFGPKLVLYQRAGVREYVTIELFGQRIVWRVLENGVYISQKAPADGVLRSQVFPGLWLDVKAFWDDNGTKMLTTLNAGLSLEDHQRFVEALAGKR
jgi:Uma2 family endonuclease